MLRVESRLATPHSSGIPQAAARVDAFVRPRLQATPIVGRDALTEAKAVAKEWSAIAKRERRIMRRGPERKALKVNRGVNACIKERLEDMLTMLGMDADYEVYACVKSDSDDKKMQGLMVVERSPSCLFVEYLVTNPYNLCANSVGAPRVKGVGTCLIEHAKELAQAEGCGSIQLQFAKVAKGFYERCGFTILEQGRTAVLKIA